MGTLLDNKPDKDELNRKKEQISAVLRDSDEKFPLEKALAVSAVAHPLIPFLVWFLITILALFGINLALFQKPEIKPRDIEFVLATNKEQPPINKKTNLRSDRNSRAGGKNNPKMRVSEPEKVSRPSRPQRASAQQSPTHEQQQQKPQHAPRPHPQQTSPQIPPRPKNIQAAPPRIINHNPFSIPVPKVKAPRAVAPVGAPVTTGPVGTYSPSGDPSPMMSTGGRRGSSRGSRSSGYSSGNGDPGNPSPGNLSGAPGVDALKEPDFGPFMMELRRKIKRNWHPPRGNESKKVILIFKVAKDGRLLQLNIKRSSGNPDADDAALQAVRMSAPFRQLPPEYQESSINIEFSFEYNVIGGDIRY